MTLLDTRKKKKNLAKKQKVKKLTPKLLALIFLVSGLFLVGALLYPISQVFSGEWVLKQGFDLFSLKEVKLFGEAFPVGSVSIRFYSLCVLVGLISGFFLSIYLARRHKISASLIDRLFVGLVVFGLIGARVFYVLFNLEAFEQDWMSVLYITKGGLSIFGAVFTGIIYIWQYCKRYKFNFFEFADILAPGLLLGQIIGRFGNFFNYEGYGEPTNVFWKMFVPEPAIIVNNYDYNNLYAEYFHPTFLYEIIPNFVLLLFLLWRYDKLTYKKSGIVFASYLVGYGAIRFFTEFFRLDALKIELITPLKFNTPEFVVRFFEWIKMPEFFIAWIESFEAEYIRISQIAALLIIVIGYFVYRKRKKVIFFKKSMKEYDVS